MAFYGEFLDNIEKTLQKNGYPEKRVALPREKLAQAASEKGLEFDRVLNVLRETGVGHKIEGERVIFSSMNQIQDTVPSSLEEKARSFAEVFKDIDPQELAALQGMNKIKMLFKLRELSKKLGPEQIAKLQEFYAGLSDSEKVELAAKSKEMGMVD